MHECEDTRATHGTVSVYMGVFSHVWWLVPSPPLKPSVGELKVQGPPHCVMGLYHPQCLNIYCPGWRVPRKAVVYLLTLG